MQPLRRSLSRLTTRAAAGAGALALVFGGFVAAASPASATPLNAPIVGMAPTPDAGGYWLVGADGGIFTYGNAAYHGSAASIHLNAQIVGMAATPDGGGYWLVAADGGIFTFGDAVFHGSAASLHLNANVVGMAATPDGGGYWLVAADGGIFTFGDAVFHGSMGGQHLNAPVVGMAATPDARGYWLVASDGGIFAFGDAAFHGSMAGQHLNAPVVGMAATLDGGGYWLVAADGGIFTFGDAPFEGSMAGTPLAYPVSGMAHDPVLATGYWLVAQDGGIFTFGGAPFHGSHGGQGVRTPPSSGNCSPNNKCTPPSFADAIITYPGIGGPVTTANEFALETWERAEGGGAGCPGQPAFTAPWRNSAGPAGNPIATTQFEPGSTDWNSVHVKVYADAAGHTCWFWGIKANGDTLNNGRYGSIINALQHPAADQLSQCIALARAVGSTPWGTGDFERDC